MPDYAIGDIQGCYDPLMRLLDSIHFNERADRIWLVGDLVNRGPESLKVLRFIKNLPLKPVITLGNHDLHLLVRLFDQQQKKINADDTLHAILAAPDREELGDWLRQQSILVHAPDLDIVICHAGIAPLWDLDTAKRLAAELEQVLHSPDYKQFLAAMYGNEPSLWQDDLIGMDRLRAITNYFTRMRFCDKNGRLVLNYKGTIAQAPANLIPWFAVPHRIPIEAQIVFGHWAALRGYCPVPRIHAIDTGCLWGGQLTALRLQDKKRFAVSGQ
ncbi:bis(5'-nucleosyl)-tetraphosphatase [Legionella birminghamensis]|uniref:Bis(5'-nucleosyl)-tetraphosphatase, symmetrical n=1 Tax=Legionella birminghamensis TaxID=28083 RepID=A0A378I6D3_9GAMM|nr:symmetrical bis(5'-nucleosyl)-tetraphosphatase [Legionella birminghamensis]KTC68708.1 bis(5'-nucleosyl)-tetraphosphatase [Legionella birminghamensis]STX30306.1 bis(5'-nucleosyl)-tetraphosphatase [Legionella birminghamensis]